MANYCSISLVSLFVCKCTQACSAHVRVHAELNKEQEAQFTGVQLCSVHPLTDTQFLDKKHIIIRNVEFLMANRAEIKSVKADNSLRKKSSMDICAVSNTNTHSLTLDSHLTRIINSVFQFHRELEKCKQSDSQLSVTIFFRGGLLLGNGESGPARIYDAKCLLTPEHTPTPCVTVTACTCSSAFVEICVYMVASDKHTELPPKKQLAQVSQALGISTCQNSQSEFRAVTGNGRHQHAHSLMVNYPEYYLLHSQMSSVGDNPDFALGSWLAEAENSQRVLDNESSQHLKMRERQRFFEEVYQQDVDNYVPSAHLQINSRKLCISAIYEDLSVYTAPMGSISSMEVNVDVLEQMDLMDISDQEALDVFLNSGSGAEEGALASPLPVGEGEDEEEEDEDAEVLYRDRAPLKQQSEVCSGSKSRMSSTSSGSSETSGGCVDTPVIQSDDDEVHADTLLLTSVPQTRDDETEEEDEEERCLETKSS
ncbi:Dysbindin Biogenesis of lysosome-related organelles complex 1 subunit 8 [Channa argus]|uniref:Dysbindin Biogenesis of lysosome-related organelles complex 1 subunit 8 n=1 Tax=Channa argus TaxID=215402 RepID=A0A6G1Q3R0_CHAAH|nr:Dysbindin Biogenesis of lysosome-related organelles complex 1 subunit 8 [Channa argus]